jgi:ubiquinone/menaquinone biosynthesis C-methylase UbiE
MEARINFRKYNKYRGVKMIRPRIIETGEGIQGEMDVKIFDEAKRMLRDKGWLETNDVIGAGINKGSVLEIGSGPDYLGLEWLKKTEKTRLTGLEISSNMIRVAQRNAGEYGLESRVNYTLGDAHKLPFSDNEFDGVFSCESLHEWVKPGLIFSEIYRVLKPNGKFFVGDLRRDMNPFMVFLMKALIKSREMKEGLISSINAAYTAKEMESIIAKTGIRNCSIHRNLMGICIVGEKS